MKIERIGRDVRLHPIGSPVDASVRLPGSKSLTNRHLLCAALSGSPATLHGASFSDDALAMVEGLRSLGIPIDLRIDQRCMIVRGCRGLIPADEASIDIGNAGTAMRFLTALCTLGRGRYRLNGSPRMRERPIGALVDALAQLGAAIGYEDTPGCPPLTILGRGLPGGQVAFRETPSSQFLSALLMVAPYAADDVYISIEGDLPSRPYIDMTIAVMRDLGVEVLESADARKFIVAAGQTYAAGDGLIHIEPDASAATYFWAAAAIAGGQVRVNGLDFSSRQGDVRFAMLLEQMGCRAEAGDRSLTVTGPPHGALNGIEVDLNDMPDTVQTLAVTALFARGPTRISNVANLRLKETDRLHALGVELTRLGARIEVYGSGITIHPPNELTPATIHTYDDHRMAMSFALAGLRTDGITIRDADCVSKSVPEFFDLLAEL